MLFGSMLLKYVREWVINVSAMTSSADAKIGNVTFHVAGLLPKLIMFFTDNH